ncbi:MAG TPA: SgcJ/EcaC family oxidoreductase [Thermoanaerobaculia bacterium]|nr:SgcJ/EcaC family oxidoreductase [Thermoanaerobaculia bacterium]
MKRSWVVLTVVFLAVAGGAAVWGEKTVVKVDDSGLTEQLNGFVAAWNRHDAKAMAATFAMDASFVNPFGQALKGRPAIETLFVTEQAGGMKSSTLAASNATERLVRPDLGIQEWDFEITGIQGAPDAPPSSLKGHVLSILQKKGGNWQVLSALAAAPLPPPPAPKP